MKRHVGQRGRERHGKCLRRVARGEGFERWAEMLGAQMQHVREELDVPASELAAAIGVRHTTVHHWEAGDIAPPLRRLKQVADALGVLVMDLMPRAS